MANEKKTISEYEQELLKAELEMSGSEEKESAKPKKKKKKSGRGMLIAFLLVMCAIPLLLCIYLIIRVNSMDGRLDRIAGALGVSSNDLTEYHYLTEATTGRVTEDDDAYLTPEKEMAADIVFLAENYSEAVIAEENKEEADGEKNNEIIDEDSEAVEAAEAEQTENDKAAEEELPEKKAAQSGVKYNGKKVYLTFDDGPSIHTAEILDILKKNNVKATFFVVHHDEPGLEKLYSRIVDDGHTIGMHSYSHVYEELYASEEAFEKDVKDIHDYIKKVTGVDSKFYRFPGGSSNDVSDNVNTSDMIDFLDREGIVYFDWNSASLDAEDSSLSPDELNANVMTYVESNPGDSIVLMHDFEYCEPTVAALQSLIDTLKSEGYDILPITDKTEPVQHVTK